MHINKIALLGWGISCKSVYEFFKNKTDIYIWDDNESIRDKLLTEGKNVVSPEYWGELSLQFIVCSPGMPLLYPVKHIAKTISEKYNIPIVCDIELYYMLNPHIKYIGITGSNGKSTVTSLIYHVMKHNKYKVAVGGNIGVPIFNIHVEDIQWIVLELSSYQLELCNNLRLEYGVYLNLSPDHLDHHGGYLGYIKAKENILELTDTIVINDILLTKDIPNKKFLTVGKDKDVCVQYNLNTVIDNYFDKNSSINIVNKSLKGLHNQENISFVYTIAKLLGIATTKFKEACDTYIGLEHRQEFIVKYKNITFINDSKATNIQSTERAIENYQNIYLIAGGKFKGTHFDMDNKLLSNIKKIFIIGKDKKQLVNFCLYYNINHECYDSLEKATEATFCEALNDKNESVILLSPAAASFDQFNNFEHRGQVFKNKVKSLINNV